MPIDKNLIRRQNNVSPSPRQSRERPTVPIRRGRTTLPSVMIFEFNPHEYSFARTIRFPRTGIPGIDAINEIIARLIQQARATVSAARFARFMEEYGRRLCQIHCPVDTGRLRSSLDVYTLGRRGIRERFRRRRPPGDNVSIWVGSDVDYFKYNLRFTDTVRRAMRSAARSAFRQSVVRS